MKEDDSTCDCDTIHPMAVDEGTTSSLHKGVGKPLGCPRRIWLLLLAAVIVIIIVASVMLGLIFGGQPRSTVCGPSTSHTTGIGSCSFTMLDWNSDCTYIDEDGKAQVNRLTQKMVILSSVTNGKGGSGSECHSSTEKDFAVCHSSEYKDEEELYPYYNYTATTFRNQTISVWVDGVDYDLQQGGGLFLIYSNDNDDNDDAAMVVQLQEDLTNVRIDFDADEWDGMIQSIVDLIQSNEEVSALCFPDE